MWITKDVFRHLFHNIIDINEHNVRVLINMYNSCKWMKECMTYDQMSFVEEWKNKAKPRINKYFMDLENDIGECSKCGKRIKYEKLSKHQNHCNVKPFNYMKNDIEFDYCKICKWRHPMVSYHYRYKDKETLQCDFMRTTHCRFCKSEIYILNTRKHEDKCKKRCECVLRKRMSSYERKLNNIRGKKESQFYFEQCKLKKSDNSNFCRFHN